MKRTLSVFVLTAALALAVTSMAQGAQRAAKAARSRHPRADACRGDCGGPDLRSLELPGRLSDPCDEGERGGRGSNGAGRHAGDERRGVSGGGPLEVSSLVP